jgi:alpha-L-fucosidase 2
MPNTSGNPLTWHFPMRRPHTGVVLGNGIQGFMIWGEHSLLLTVARAGFWDHRGSKTMPPDTTFAAVRTALEKEDFKTLTDLFPQRGAGTPFPQQFGGGRIELTFTGGRRPLGAVLDLATAVLEIRVGLSADDPAPTIIRMRQAATGEICWLDLPTALADGLKIKLMAAHELVFENAMAAIGIAPPDQWTDEHSGGFLQRLPADDPLAVAWRLEGTLLLVTTALGLNARAEVENNFNNFDFVAAQHDADVWWAEYWQRVPNLILPDAPLQELFDFGLYRQAGLIRRHAPAATLQGPWMEDTRIPPWSNDYHFNINVQMVYGAALATNQAEEMMPLWDMLKRWLPQLQAMGESFYRVPDAMLLPHAVDDRCQMMGDMWSGAIDQACIAWMGQLAWQHYRYTLDRDHLREVAWPLLRGAFLGYFAMLETVTEADGRKRYSLPLSVSPEFGGAEMRECWGRDASFQLAALHATIRELQAAAAVLNEPADPRWVDVGNHLPAYTLDVTKDDAYGWIGSPRQCIALWQGKNLPVSHRHHSHLAALYPFATIDPFDPAHRKIVAWSLNHWATLGPGNWTGWCVAWASALCSRCGLPDAAQSWLHLLDEAFTTEGRAPLHNANHAGMFGWDDGSLAWPDFRKGPDFIYHEVMQMDAAMGAITAVLGMLVQHRADTICIADHWPKRWRDFSFDRIRTEGVFLIGATVHGRRVREVRVESLAGQPLRLRHGITGAWQVNDGPLRSEPVFETATSAGERYVLRAI